MALVTQVLGPACWEVCMAREWDDHRSPRSDGAGSEESGRQPVDLTTMRAMRTELSPRPLVHGDALGSRRRSGAVPSRWEGLPLSALPGDYAHLVAVLTLPEAAAGLRARAVVALLGIEPLRPRVRTTRIKLRRLVALGWALEVTPGIFVGAPGLDSRLGVPRVERPGVTAVRSNVVQITRALADRTVIEQAKGLLVEDGSLTPAEARACLADYAGRTAQSLSGLAYALVGGERTTAELLGASGWGHVEEESNPGTIAVQALPAGPRCSSVLGRWTVDQAESSLPTAR